MCQIQTPNQVWCVNSDSYSSPDLNLVDTDQAPNLAHLYLTAQQIDFFNIQELPPVFLSRRMFP